MYQRAKGRRDERQQGPKEARSREEASLDKTRRVVRGGSTDLEDIGSLVGDNEDVEVLEGLVDEPDVVGLDGGVLGAGGDELGEGGEEAFDSRFRHLDELTRDDG
jgi:hypothetical protein